MKGNRHLASQYAYIKPTGIINRTLFAYAHCASQIHAECYCSPWTVQQETDQELAGLANLGKVPSKEMF